MTPRPMAWTIALPTAVASSGPATTFTPHAFAVSWLRKTLREPPPTIWITELGEPLTWEICSETMRYFRARLS